MADCGILVFDMAPLLSVENLHVRFDTDEGSLHAVDGVSLSLSRGEVLCVVGESGCGKSALAMSIPHLLPTPPASFTADKMELDGVDLLHVAPRELWSLRGSRIGIVFQEPMTALSPLHRVGDQIEEAIRLHRPMPAQERKNLALEWLDKVGISNPARAYSAWPHELSGGMQQRVMIAMALVNDPDLVIADEPTTALDVTTQAQVLALMRRLIGKESGLLLITHDMGVVSEMATRVAVMYAGQIVETAPCDELFHSPRHPYTRALLAALPSSATRGRRLPAIPGSVPSPLDWPEGCRFRDRCAFAKPECLAPPPVYEACPNHFFRCTMKGTPS